VQFFSQDFYSCKKAASEAGFSPGFVRFHRGSPASSALAPTFFEKVDQNSFARRGYDTFFLWATLHLHVWQSQTWPRKTFRVLQGSFFAKKKGAERRLAKAIKRSLAYNAL